MKKDIKKYIIVLIGALFVASLWGLLLGVFLFRLNVSLSMQAILLKYSIPAYNFLIHLTIALIVRRDMQNQREKINYLILLLILINEFAGIGIFLMTRFFNHYQSVNTSSHAKTD